MPLNKPNELQYLYRQLKRLDSLAFRKLCLEITYEQEAELFRKRQIQLGYLNGELRCSQCQKGGLKLQKARLAYRCHIKKCGASYNLKSGTLFNDIPLERNVWLSAFYLWNRSKIKSGSVLGENLRKAISAESLCKKTNEELEKMESRCNASRKKRLSLHLAKKLLRSFNEEQAFWLRLPPLLFGTQEAAPASQLRTRIDLSAKRNGPKTLLIKGF